MRKKKWITTNKRRKMSMLKLVLAFFMFMGIGYSALSTKLSINGNLEVAEYLEPTLYNVLKKEAISGRLAKKYTGEHHDSFTEEPSKDIYHWYAKNNTEGTAILDKNNVIFAGHCWQMIRTTDTGGVKMIYNGEPENNKCLDTRGTHVGYAERTSQNLASNYWYGTDYTYDNSNETFKLSGTTEQVTWDDTTGPELIGKYTCKSTSVDGTCSTLYLVESYYNTLNAYVIPLNSNSNYSVFGTLQFNAIYNSLSHVGYMYNTVYPSQSKSTLTESVLSGYTFSTSYWYAHDMLWGSPTANTYNLINPYQVSSTTDYPNLVGEYTFRNSSQTYTGNTVWYIAAVDNTTAYIFQLDHSSINPRHTLADFNYTYTYGDSYTDNGDGTYTITNQDESNPTTINRVDWYTGYSNVGAGKYVCKNAVNNTCSDLWYTTSTSITSIHYIKVLDNYKYAKGFTWDGSKYILDNDNSVTFWNYSDSNNRTSLNNAHYTCWNEAGECTTISYIFYIDGTTRYYINLTGGKNVETALNEMLHENGVNSINSTIKSGVDAWYKHYLLEDYDDYIEDTIFCNDRSQSNAATNGWNPDGGRTSTNMYFYGASDLSCPNDTDKFSVSNSKAQLTYKVGLMSYGEMNLLVYYNAYIVRRAGQYYWLASPSRMNYGSPYCSNVRSSGVLDVVGANGTYGVRPAVSLRPGIEYSSGDGSMANPYVVKIDSNSGN